VELGLGDGVGVGELLGVGLVDGDGVALVPGDDPFDGLLWLPDG
jgi:hypothetical protein